MTNGLGNMEILFSFGNVQVSFRNILEMNQFVLENAFFLVILFHIPELSRIVIDKTAGINCTIFTTKDMPALGQLKIYWLLCGYKKIYYISMVYDATNLDCRMISRIPNLEVLQLIVLFGMKTVKLGLETII